MKNKTKILLVISAIILWGMIGYKIYSQWGGTKGGDIIVKKKDTYREYEVSDTFISNKLMVDYPDPFLKGIASDYSPSLKAKQPVKPLPKTLTKWPVISYKGMIAGNSKQNVLAVIEINGKEVLMKPLSIIDSITLVNLYNDSAIFIFRKEKKTIRRM